MPRRNPSNRREAIRGMQREVEEGADMLMGKPGIPYLDRVADVLCEI